MDKAHRSSTVRHCVYSLSLLSVPSRSISHSFASSFLKRAFFHILYISATQRKDDNNDKCVGEALDFLNNNNNNNNSNHRITSGNTETLTMKRGRSSNNHNNTGNRSTSSSNSSSRNSRRKGGGSPIKSLDLSPTPSQRPVSARSSSSSTSLPPPLQQPRTSSSRLTQPVDDPAFTAVEVDTHAPTTAAATTTATTTAVSSSLLLKLATSCAKHKASQHSSSSITSTPALSVSALRHLLHSSGDLQTTNTLPVECTKALTILEKTLPKLERTYRANPAAPSATTVEHVGHICDFYQDVIRGGFCPHAPHLLLALGQGATQGENLQRGRAMSLRV